MRHRHIMEMRSEMKYIESLREGERINEIYLCKVKQSALTKAGKPYDNLILQDKTGTLDAKIWEPGSVGIDEFDSLDYIAVMGDITSFQGNLQLNVKRVRKVQEGEYDPKDYLPVSKKDIDGMYTELLGLIASVKHPYLRKLLESFFVEDKDFEKRFKFHSAAKSVHHGFVGGLLEHTLSVTKSTSEIALINQNGYGTVTGYANDLMTKALNMCQRTDGALDISIYPIVRSWGFTTGRYQIPDDNTISNLLSLVDYTRIQYNSSSGDVVLPAGMEIDLGSVAKGYTGQKVADLLKKEGITYPVEVILPHF